jgi:hypothetical protein
LSEPLRKVLTPSQCPSKDLAGPSAVAPASTAASSATPHRPTVG